MKILVTGGAGFIGSHLVDALVAEGQSVRVLDSLDPQVHGAGADWPAYVSPKAEYLRGDVRDAEWVRRALDGVEVVIHDAAAVGVAQSMYEIASYVSANSLGAAVLLQEIIAKKGAIRRLVVASSMSIYGEGAYLDADGKLASPGLRPDSQLEKREWELCDASGRALRPIGTPETKPLQPTSVYAVSKRDHEELFLAVGNAYGIPTVALRYFNVYGSRQALSNPYTGVAAIFSSRLLNGNRPLVTEDGEQSRDFVHVSDIVRANLLALRCEAGGGRVCNVGTGRPTTIRRVAELLAERLKLKITPDITGKFRAGDIRHCFSDPGGAKRVLGFEAKVKLEDGIDEVIQFARSQKPRDDAEKANRELAERGLTR
ncbi:MAG TPA: NAD-dependent epimerase/dehydratase family protein [Myxococcota bacterium]|nr:NAD-dependent epimerase/dehydratase family protein [Myxococcota bacterium]